MSLLWLPVSFYTIHLLRLPFFNLFPGLVLFLNILFPQYFLYLNKQLITVLLREFLRFFASSTRQFFYFKQCHVGMENLHNSHCAWRGKVKKEHDVLVGQLGGSVKG